jgi:sugar phosphate permease
MTPSQWAWMSSLNDLGGIIGSILIGLSADKTRRPAQCAMVLLVVAVCVVRSLEFLLQSHTDRNELHDI